MKKGIIWAEHVKERSPLAALALSLAATGLGQMYNGELARGAAFLLLRVMAVALIPVTLLSGGSGSLVRPVAALLTVSIVVALASLAEAAWCAARSESVPLARYNSAPWYVAFGLGAWLLTGVSLASLVPLLGLARTADSRMEPSFAPGETVLVSWHRGGKLVPGDVVLVERDGETLMGRIVALPGDAVSVKDGAVQVNGAAFPAGVLSDDQAAGLSVVNGETLFYESNGGGGHAVYAKPESMSAAPDAKNTRELAKGRYLLACDNRLEENCFEEIEEGAVLARVEGIVVGKSWRRMMGSGFVR
jgi:type IV secretory pathway protease TraF